MVRTLKRGERLFCAIGFWLAFIHGLVMGIYGVALSEFPSPRNDPAFSQWPATTSWPILAVEDAMVVFIPVPFIDALIAWGFYRARSGRRSWVLFSAAVILQLVVIGVRCGSLAHLIDLGWIELPTASGKRIFNFYSNHYKRLLIDHAIFGLPFLLVIVYWIVRVLSARQVGRSTTQNELHD